ncbi:MULTISPECIES: flavin reductase family protein [unclassified Rhizobium]|uniref:flavin reductase family protein n=1 Tax=unclassified Rhizobium TaxID=2613769 RepID=UPI000EAA46C4|nr:MULTISPECIES: flavin reductase family protein [unclassified Rhizobium]AYG69352.1 flavin reductase [Rhizobium sp. CCGE531]AYG75731.1 flavin reductase [Rhizobium sp. CCGE532]
MINGSSIDQDSFKLSMRHLAGAVSVITVGEGEERTGFTATSVSSLSADVPSVIVSLNRASSSWSILERHRCFCVNVLAEDQQHIARSFAGLGGRRGAERYRDADWYHLKTGAAALENALTVLDCELEKAIHHHSHVILIGRVCAIDVRPHTSPLLYWDGGYRRLGAAADLVHTN